MEDPSLHWQIEEEYYPSEESSGKVSWILKKGLVFGKKVLMTGMLITSAPFVLPPLVAISAFGVAASVPSGFFLASYACSEKIMSSLLPGSSAPSMFLLGCEDVPKTDRIEQEEEEEEEGDVGFNEQGIDMEKEEQEQIDDTKGRVEMRIELPVMHAASDETVKEKGRDEVETMSGDHAKSNLAPNELQEEIVLKIETAHEKANDDEFGRNEIPIEVRDVVVMETGGHESIEEGELAKETTGLIEKFRDEGKQAIVDETAEEMDMPIEAKSAGRKGKRKGGGKKKGKVDEPELPKQNEQISAKRDDSTEAAKPTISTPETHQGKVQITGDNVINGGAKAPKKTHHSGRLTEEKAGLKGVSSPSKKEGEGFDSEGEIRKQIEAMKAIVGYKGTPKPHASCVEELKALYRFTGVEPPESFKDPSDIEELSHKLKFLMSIVGVK